MVYYNLLKSFQFYWEKKLPISQYRCCFILPGFNFYTYFRSIRLVFDVFSSIYFSWQVWEVVYSKDGSVKEVLRVMQLKGHKVVVYVLCEIHDVI